jgi:hypothetical protein
VTPDPDYEQRLYETARILLNMENEPLDEASPMLDQMNAAAEEMSTALLQALPAIQEDVDLEVYTNPTEKIPLSVAAHLLVACDFENIRDCGHLSSPQPAFVFLTHRVMTCRACTIFVPDHVDPDDDSCDYCRRTGVRSFTPMLTMLGSILISGEACDDCAAKLRPA